jgi:CRISPR/Cas system-associated protein Cas5 (RAMP superfamily)
MKTSDKIKLKILLEQFLNEGGPGSGKRKYSKKDISNAIKRNVEQKKKSEKDRKNDFNKKFNDKIKEKARANKINDEDYKKVVAKTKAHKKILDKINSK